MRPRILLFAIQTSHTGSCRLPKMFSEAGFEVGILGLRSSLLQVTAYADRKYVLRARRFEPLIRMSLESAFAAFEPQIIVPCDERAISVVNHWILRGRSAGLSESLFDCLGRSLGDLSTLPLRLSKMQTLALARSIGVRCPRDIKVDDLAACRAAAQEFGFPVVVKLSHGAGGNGVRLCHTFEELERAYSRFSNLRSVMKTLRRKLLKREWFGETYKIFVQEFMAGVPAMSCASAIAGRTLSVVSGVVSQTVFEGGPASVATVGHHPAVAEATSRMIAAMGASGFISFDFIVGPDGEVSLLECNPRPTQILHLAPLVGADPALALARALAEGPSNGGYETPSGEREIAFFPQEWRRDPKSPRLRHLYHDVPWDDPALLAAMMAKRPITWRRRTIP